MNDPVPTVDTADNGQGGRCSHAITHTRCDDTASSPLREDLPTRSPRQRLLRAMPLGSVWTARSSLGNLKPGPMRLVAFRSSYMEFDAGARYATRIGYPPVLRGLEISQDCCRVTLIENGFVAVFERQ